MTRIALVVASLLLGCAEEGEPKGGGEVGGPKTVVVDPGSGTESTEPLWPLTVGLRRQQKAGVIAVPDRTQKFGKTLYRFQGASTVRFYEKNDEGVFSVGSITLGALPREVLLVPSKVKVGMKWQSFETTDQPSITSVVKSATMMDTIFGPRMVWVIEQTDEVGKKTYSTSFAEGRGPIVTDGEATTLSIVPLDPEPALATSSRLALTPLGDMPVFSDFWATNLSAIVDDFGKNRVRAGGLTTWYNNTGFSATWDIAPHTACISVTGDGKAYAKAGDFTDTGPGSSATDPLCPEASGSLYLDGMLQQIDVAADGSIAKDHTGLHVNSANMTEDWLIQHDPNQNNLPIWVLGLGGQMYTVNARVYGGEIVRTWMNAGGAFERILVDSTAPADDFGFAAMFGDRIVGGKSFGTSFSALDLALGAPGAHLSTRLTTDGREHYLVTADGVVDRLHIGTDGTISAERYAELDLPAQHELVGIVPFSDHLLVLLLAGREENPQGGTPAKPMMGDVWAFEAPLPSAQSMPERAMLPHNAITAEVIGRDLKVCWPKSAGAAITDGWTLGGQAVRAVASGASGDCVVLIRDKSAAITAEGAYAAEGSIPGAGKVSIGIHTPENFETVPVGMPGQLAALSSGGFMSTALRYGTGGDIIGVPGMPGTVGAGGRVADAAGHGIWWPNTYQTRVLCAHDNPAAVMTGETSKCILAPFPGSIGPVVAGGGVVWVGDSTTTPTIIKPDGTMSAIMGLATDAIVAGVLADGTACGVSGAAGARKIFCDQAGTVTTASITQQQYGFLQAPWAPVGNIFYSLADGTAPMRIDPATLTIDALDETALGTPGGYFHQLFSSDGKLFAVHHTGTEVHLYAVEGTALTAADPEGYAPFAAMTQDFMVTNELVIALTTTPAPDDMLRFPRK